MSDIQLFKYLKSINDPHQQGKQVHELFDIIFLAVSTFCLDAKAGRVFKI